jgi:hypothetical protein
MDSRRGGPQVAPSAMGATATKRIGCVYHSSLPSACEPFPLNCLR